MASNRSKQFIASSEQDVLIFVYGTLRKGESNHHYLQQAVCLGDECWTYGKLYDTGLGYPVLVDDPACRHRVIGELYRVPLRQLPVIDKLEDYNEDRKDNLYRRVTKEVIMKGQVIQCYVYVNAGLPIDASFCIPSGDWRSYRLNKQSLYPLRFQESWDRGISHQDRALFITLNVEYPGKTGRISFLPVRTGITYEGNLFATVIIQNGTSKPVIFDNTWVGYQQDGRIIATHPFSIPNIEVQANTSTPWTFLFPAETFGKHVSATFNNKCIPNWNITLVED